MIDATTRLLFSPFYREVGNPSRRKVYKSYQFEQFIAENNGANECFAGVYPLTGVIDKVFQDIDGSTIRQSQLAVVKTNAKAGAY